MKFNKFVWDNFIESERGVEARRIFNKIESLYLHPTNELKDFIKKTPLLSEFYEQFDFDAEREGILADLKELRETIVEGVIPANVNSISEAATLWNDVGCLITEDEEEDVFYLEDVPHLSVALYLLYPKYFFPYFFYLNFGVLTKIFETFGIFLPAVPTKGDFAGRYDYYFELCKSLHDYWTKLDLRTEDIPVFLYVFSPEVLDLKKPQFDQLPKPQRVWFIGGGVDNNRDFEYLDLVTDPSTTFWQGNKNTQVGDIVIMYCLSPRSYIHSIWRAIEAGSVEPFFRFYSTINVGYPKVVKSISIAELREDKILSEFPLVKGNMQGINGRNVPKRHYDQILSILESKGQDISSFPRLEDGEWQGAVLKNERDVETALLEPLLLELGYSSDRWTRQAKLKVGRSERAIPDYLIDISANRSGVVSAFWVWEAKFSIFSNSHLKRDFEQVCSYAKLVDAEGVGLISKEGLWISLRKDKFAFNKVHYWSIANMFYADKMNEIRDLLRKH